MKKLLIVTALLGIALTSCVGNSDTKLIKIIGSHEKIVLSDYRLEAYEIGDTVALYFSVTAGEYRIDPIPHVGPIDESSHIFVNGVILESRFK